MEYMSICSVKVLLVFAKLYISDLQFGSNPGMAFKVVPPPTVILAVMREPSEVHCCIGWCVVQRGVGQGVSQAS